MGLVHNQQRETPPVDLTTQFDPVCPFSDQVMWPITCCTVERQHGVGKNSRKWDTSGSTVSSKEGGVRRWGWLCTGRSSRG